MALNLNQYSSPDYIVKFNSLKNDEQSDNCCFHLLNLTYEYPEWLILGPCLKSHLRIPSSLRLWFPQRSGELLPIQRPSIVDIWATEPSRVGFPYFRSRFLYMVSMDEDRQSDTACLEKGGDWNCSPSSVNEDLNLGFPNDVISFWSPSTNCFFFP